MGFAATARGEALVFVGGGFRGGASQVIPSAIEELTEISLGPDWDTLTDRQAELLTAVAALGGRTSVGALEVALGRTQKDWSRTRDELIKAGILYVPRRAELRISVPAMAESALANYPRIQGASATPLIPLAQMRAPASDAVD